MLRQLIAVVMVSVAVSSNAFGMGWHCTDATGGYWKFHADAGIVSGDIAATAPGVPFSVNGRYWNVVMNNSWSMNILNNQYNCVTSDGGQGKSYNCANLVNPAAFVSLFNCEGGLFD
ncbi:MAG: hypothetical protein RL011_371 [Pseudomonadota bacterium]